MSENEYISRDNIMGTKPIGSLLAKMALPMIVSMLGQAFYNVVDSIYVAQLSEQALSAVSMAFPLQNIMIGMGVGTGVGVNTIVSRSLGERNQRTADKVANVSIALALVLSLIFAVLGLTVVRPFYAAQTDITDIINYGTDYLSICMIFCIGIFYQFCFERMLQATGRTGLAMVTQLIGAGINIIMDPVLIFGLAGFPAMGVKGAAIATVLGQIVAALVAFIINIKKNPDIHIHTKDIRLDVAVIKQIYQIGLPSFIMNSIGSVMIFFFNKIIIEFTDTAVAVFGAYFKLQSFVFMPVFGLNNGMVPIIAYNYGASKPDRVKKTIKLAIAVATLIMVAGLALEQIIPEKLLLIFNASPDMLSIGVPALRIMSLSYLFAGFCVMTGSVCQALGTPVFSTITAFCRQLVVFLPAAYLLAKTGKLENVWWAMPIAELMSLALSLLFMKITMKKMDEEMSKRN